MNSWTHRSDKRATDEDPGGFLHQSTLETRPDWLLLLRKPGRPTVSQGSGGAAFDGTCLVGRPNRRLAPLQRNDKRNEGAEYARVSSVSAEGSANELGVLVRAGNRWGGNWGPDTPEWSNSARENSRGSRPPCHFIQKAQQHAIPIPSHAIQAIRAQVSVRLGCTENQPTSPPLPLPFSFLPSNASLPVKIVVLSRKSFF